MNRRTFLISSGVAGIGALVSNSASGNGTEPESAEAFSWNTSELQFQFSVVEGRLRQHLILPVGVDASPELQQRAGVETALLCSGEDSPDSGLKQSTGSPGERMKFVTKNDQRNKQGKTLILKHTDADLHLNLQSHYQAFEGLPLVRRHVEITNIGAEPVGIDYLSSAMLHGLADPVHYDGELKIWLAYNSWMAEGQWHSFRPSELGFVENGRTSWSQASAGSVGS